MENQEGKEAGKVGLAQGFEDFAVGGLEIAGVDPGGTGGGHEIGIVGPAGDDVDVEVLRNTGAGGGAKIEPNVKPLRLHGLAECIGHAVDQGPEIGGLLRGEESEVVDLAVGADHEMAEVVGVTIQDGKGCLGTAQDKMSGIVGTLGDF